MNVLDLRGAIIAKKIPPVLIFTGDEVGVQDVYINQIAKALGVKVQSAPTLADLWKQKLNNRIGAPVLSIVRNDDAVLKDDAAWKCINALRGMGGNVVLKFQKIDKRLKFGKTFSEIIIDFERLSAEQLSKYIIARLDCTPDRAVKLAYYCGCDYLRAMLESDKILRFAKVKNIANINSVFDLAERYGVISKDTQAGVFDFVDLVVRKDKKCLDVYQKLLQSGEVGVTTLSLIFMSLKNVLVAQSDPGGKGVQERTGLAPFLFFKARENSGYFSNEELENLLSFIKGVEQGVKLGKIEEEEAVPYVLAKLLC